MEVVDGTLDFSTDITVETWAKLNSPDSQEVMIYQNGFIDLRMTTNAFFVYLNVNDSWSSPDFGPLSSTGFTPQSNEWYHLVTTYTSSSNSWKIYIDGSLNNQTIFGVGLFDKTNNWQIGYAYGGTGFNGSIDEVRIYNRALSEDEVTRLYQMGR